MAKRIALYMVIGLLGVLVGYLVFSNSERVVSPNETEITLANEYWTCSMHPQVNGEENGSCPLCGMDLVKGQTTSDYPAHYVPMSEEALALEGIETVVVGAKNKASSTLMLSGEITTNKNTDAVQTTIFAGRLDALTKNTIGERVRKGEKIGEVYSPELYSGQDKLISAKTYRETHIELYKTVRNTGGLWKLTDDQIDEVFRTNLPITTFPLISDVSGEVVEVYAEQGNFYMEGAPLYKVSDMRTVWAMLDVYKNQLPLIKIGDEVILTSPGVNEVFGNAKIDLIEPRLNDAARTIRVRVLINNSKGYLKPGMFVNAKVVVAQNNIMKVPKSAVIWTGKRSLVYRKPIKEEHVFELVEIELGTSYPQEYQVLQGLSYGDEIVSEGAFAIDAAAQLNGKRSMMNYDASSASSSEGAILSETNQVSDEPSIAAFGEIKESSSMQDMIKQYFLVKDALVAANFKGAKTHLLALDHSLQKVKDAHKTFTNLDPQLKLLKNSTDLSSLRFNFKDFNRVLASLLQNYKPMEGAIYVQFCPMADNNKGALWLSNEEQIKNPYFGNQMLSCGVVKSVIK